MSAFCRLPLLIKSKFETGCRKYHRFIPEQLKDNKRKIYPIGAIVYFGSLNAGTKMSTLPFFFVVKGPAADAMDAPQP
jgi:hypothetical protein